MASVRSRSPRPASGSRRKAAAASGPVPAEGGVHRQLAHRRRAAAPARRRAAGSGATSRPRMPSPSTTQIDSTTASAGTSGTWPALGMLTGSSRGVAGDQRVDHQAPASSPDCQVWSSLVPASQASTSAM